MSDNRLLPTPALPAGGEGEQALASAYRMLASLWLKEVTPAELPVLRASGLLPLGQDGSEIDLIELAAEYQRLFGFNLPPYESLFIDPSGMLDAPATARLQAAYRLAGWSPPPGARAAAGDHLGLVMLAYSSLDPGSPAAQRLLHEHLALWGPVACLSLQRIAPHPLYRQVAELTLELLLESLAAWPPPAGQDPFPTLPPPPVYRGSLPEDPFAPPEDELSGETPLPGPGLGALVQRLLTARAAGMYLTRHDLGQIGLALQLPGVVGERRHLLRTLFLLAGQYELAPALVAELQRWLTAARQSYAALAAACPAWQVYAEAWSQPVDETYTLLAQDMES